MTNQEPTLRDILEVLQTFSKNVDEQFASVDKRFEQVDGRFKQIDKRFDEVDEQFKQIDKRFDEVDKQFKETETHFDKVDKDIAGLRTDLTVVIRKEDRKLGALIDALVESHALTAQAGERILSLEPFAHV